jgi:hypothetical protein
MPARKISAVYAGDTRVKALDSGQERRQPDTDERKRVVDDDQQHQQRDRPEDVDVDLGSSLKTAGAYRRATARINPPMRPQRILVIPIQA